MEKRKKNIVLFASGNGTNAENIIRYFQEKKTVNILEVLTNNPRAGVIERAKKQNIPVFVFNRETISAPSGLIDHLLNMETDFIVLAGFLWKIPAELIRQFPQKIINLHPALLPEFGGKGMYGLHVHEAVIAAGKKKSGITIHYVDEIYDNGKIIFQAETEVSEKETPESLAEKIHQLEYKYFPLVIEEIVSGQ